ncbi:MAG: Thiol-disulfide interchange proteinpotentially involved in divalent cation resistance [Pseudomonadota bacterium]
MRRLLTLIAFFALLLPLLAAAAEPLPPEKAFKAEAKVLGADTISVNFSIAKGYYLYRDKFRFSATGAEIGEIEFPQGEMKDDDTFGRVEVFRDTLAIALPVLGASGEVKLTVGYQGCADLGVCYPPATQTFTLSLNAPNNSAKPPPQDEASRILAMLKDASLVTNIAAFFGAGLLLAFTPCVFPMIPILSGIIVGQGHGISRWRAFELSLLYVLGMAATYAAAGVAAGYSGTLLSAALQNVWVLGGFALIFVALALAMFGAYELQLPTALQSRLSEAASHQRRGAVMGVLVMGVLSALIVGPCVAAPLAGALLYIAQTGDALFGGLALFAMALGMGAPLIAVGVSTRHWLPHGGPWMEGVKKLFGVILLALALWIVQPVLPGVASMLGWAALLIGSGVMLKAIDSLPPKASMMLRLGKAAGVIALLAGVAMLAGALAGWHDPLRPLGFLRAGNEAAPAVKFERVADNAALDARIKASDKPVLLDFYADWCVACKEMERNTFPHPGVRAELEKFTLLKADVTANTEADLAMLRRFNLFGPPGIIFFKPGGGEIEGTRVIGYQGPEEFLMSLARAL